MTKGKSVYRFQFNCPPQNVNAVVQSWLQANQFTFQNKYGENMYYYHDAWNGNRGFQYTINGNVLTIYAWTIGVGKQFWTLDSGALGNMAGDSYMHILHSLFTGISTLGAVAAGQVQSYPPPNTIPSTRNSTMHTPRSRTIVNLRGSTMPNLRGSTMASTESRPSTK